VIALLLVAAAASTPALEPLRQKLGADAAFVERTHIVNEQGRTVTRVQQTFQGKRVWGGEAIVHREANGTTRVLDRGVLRDVNPEGAPRLGADQAADIAVRDLGAKGAVRREAELVVFPTRFTGGLATKVDPSRNVATLDLKRSVRAVPPSTPYVWAYEVRMDVDNPVDGHLEERAIVDASTGAVLRKWEALKHAGTASTGTGTSLFRGSVPLETTTAADGTFSLLAQGRGTLPQPAQAFFGVTQIGLQTYSGGFDIAHGTSTFLPYAEHVGNQWGNGVQPPLAWDWNNGVTLVEFSADHTLAWPKGAFTPTGETAAVDAHFGMVKGWDFYQQVFGRDGIDGLGTSTMAIVHAIHGATQANSVPYADELVWSPDYFAVFVGDGTYPFISFGFKSMLSLDMIGHELAHGVAQASAAPMSTGFSAAIDEANSDILGKMLQAWTDGSGGATIPDFDPNDATRWQFCVGCLGSGTPLRYMDRPSDDGRSGDVWYDGLQDLGMFAASGPAARFFVLLAQGVSTDPQSRRYSAYLPGGMAGIGNDHAARIWYKGMTEQLFSAADYDDARAATVTAAQELYGIGSTEEQATMKAWAAVNVGSAPGEGPRPRVTFPVTNPPGSFLDNKAVPHGILSRVQMFCTRARVNIKVDVANTDDKRTTLSLATPSQSYQVGTVNADGTWTTPSWIYYGDLHQIISTSVADPREFAKGQVLLVECDADTDTQADAIDLGLVAMQWGITQQLPPYPAAMIVNDTDWDIVFFSQAFANTYAASLNP
jgi:Zn-dependent metalloprotease